ncbi:hypothetical protein MCEMIEM13_01512 [Comamonadaceae bacterium]
MTVSIKVEGLDRAIARIGSAAKQANFAASRALNTTAFAVNDRLKKEMASTFQGGATAYSLRAFKIEKANKGNLTAIVSLRTDTGGASLPYSKALAHLFTGGRRSFKKLEGWLRSRSLLPNGLTVAPGSGMPLDRYGNMRQADLTEMLGVIGNQRRNLQVYRKSGAGKSLKAIGYFVALPGDRSGKHPGIYKRINTGTGSGVQAMVLYINPVNYRKLIDLEKVGREVVAKTFKPAFEKELAMALATAK